jgi:hypothetical protein
MTHLSLQLTSQTRLYPQLAQVKHVGARNRRAEPPKSGQHQSRRCCDEFELYLGEADEDGDDATEDDIDIEHLTRLLRGLRRTRLATAVIAALGCVMGVAALTSLILVLINNQVGAVPNTSWYSYLSYALDRLAAAIPAFACVVIAPRGWRRGSQLLKGDEPGEPVEDEPVPAAAS